MFSESMLPNTFDISYHISLSENYDYCKEVFIQLTKTIDRDGIGDFTKWLLETDFLIAPASTKYHGAEKGGLLRHSLNVYKNLLFLARGRNYSVDTIKIVSLFHDICKANFYTVSKRNVKNEITGKWEKQDYYTFDEQFPYGSHGGKSVYLLLSHGLKLTDEEAVAINNHMGGWDVTNYHNPSKAFEKYPLAVYLHIADMMATYLDE